jgi:hypothetical protein
MFKRIVGSKPRNNARPSLHVSGLAQIRIPLLSIIGLMILIPILSGCKTKAAAALPADIQNMAKLPPSADSAPPAITPEVDPSTKAAPVEPPAAPKAAADPSSLDLGLIRFRAGEYSEAAQLFEEYLQAGADKENRDFALFHLFLSRRLIDNSGKNARRAEDALKRIVTEFHKSPYAEAAEFILGLLTQIDSLKSDNKEKDARIKQLGDELQKLKEIDMQRRPSGPLY